MGSLNSLLEFTTKNPNMKSICYMDEIDTSEEPFLRAVKKKLKLIEETNRVIILSNSFNIIDVPYNRYLPPTDKKYLVPYGNKWIDCHVKEVSHIIFMLHFLWASNLNKGQNDGGRDILKKFSDLSINTIESFVHEIKKTLFVCFKGSYDVNFDFSDYANCKKRSYGFINSESLSKEFSSLNTQVPIKIIRRDEFIENFTEILSVMPGVEAIINSTLKSIEKVQILSFKDFVVAAIEIQPSLRKYAFQNWKGDEELIKRTVLEALKSLVLTALISGKDFSDLPSLDALDEQLRDDKTLVFHFLKIKGSRSFEKASDRLKNDKDVLFEAMNLDKWSLPLCYASNELRGNREVVLLMIENNCFNIKYASDELKNDKEIGLIVVKKQYSNIKFLSEELRNDLEIAEAAVKTSIKTIEYLSKNLRNNKELILLAFKAEFSYEGSYSLLEFVSDELKNDKEVVIEAVKKSGRSLRDASEELKKDRDVVMEAVRDNGRSLKYAPEFQDDEDVVKEAIKNNRHALKYASKRLQEDKQFQGLASNGITYSDDEYMSDVE